MPLSRPPSPCLPSFSRTFISARCGRPAPHPRPPPSCCGPPAFKPWRPRPSAPGGRGTFFLPRRVAFAAASRCRGGAAGMRSGSGTGPRSPVSCLPPRSRAGPSPARGPPHVRTALTARPWPKPTADKEENPVARGPITPRSVASAPDLFGYADATERGYPAAGRGGDCRSRATRPKEGLHASVFGRVARSLPVRRPARYAARSSRRGRAPPGRPRPPAPRPLPPPQRLRAGGFCPFRAAPPLAAPPD